MDESDGARELRVQCIVVAEGKIVGRGTVEEVRATWGDRDTRGSLAPQGGEAVKLFWLKRGETILPGLIDAHAHLLAYGESKSAVDLIGATSVAEVVDRIAAFIDRDPDLRTDRNRFILGLGWDQTKYDDTERKFPTAVNHCNGTEWRVWQHDLDRDPRLKGRPIYLKRIDVHALWVSPAILAALPSSLPHTVPGGEIIRLPNGAASGIFLDNAMNYINAIIPPWTDQNRIAYLRIAARSMLSRGLTSAHDAALSLSDVSFFKSLDKEGRLPVRVYGMLACDEPGLGGWCGDEEGAERYEGDRFTLRAVKIFTDGALGSWGAAMHEPYSDAPDKRGILILPEEELKPLVLKASVVFPLLVCRIKPVLMGFFLGWGRKWVEKVNVHGIGDRANTLILDAFEAALSNVSSSSSSLASKRNPLRLRVEHAQILRKEDIARMGRLEIVASFQPTHATSDMGYAEQRLGSERIKGAYAWRSMIEAGAPYAVGSDFPVESVDPFLGIYAAVTRKWTGGRGSPHGSDEGCQGPLRLTRPEFSSERLTPLEALRGFTTAAAYASFQESRVGSLSPGKEADFVVVRDGDVLELGEAKEGETSEERRRREERLETVGERVRATVVAGRVMHGAGL
ncbi:SPOSA6832_04616, partial [Sporobolomyces salmonicolor]